MIRGKLTVIGPILPTDFPTLFAWADDFEASKFNEPYRPAIWKSQEDFWLNLGADPSKVHFAIRPYGAIAIIGYVQIWNIDPINRSAMIGIRIGDEVNRGKGYGTDALKLVISYCWNQLNLSRISLLVYENNVRAIKLYTFLGFDIEGVLQKAVFIDGRWVDVMVMSILHPSRLNLEPPQEGKAQAS